MARAHLGEIGHAKRVNHKPHVHRKVVGADCQPCPALWETSELCSLPATLYLPQRGRQQEHRPAYPPWGCSPLPMETLVGQTKCTNSFISSSLMSVSHHWLRQANQKWSKTGPHDVLIYSQLPPERVFAFSSWALFPHQHPFSPRREQKHLTSRSAL